MLPQLVVLGVGKEPSQRGCKWQLAVLFAVIQKRLHQLNDAAFCIDVLYFVVIILLLQQLHTHLAW
ncbi:MAG: hypothetical protein RJA07_1300 [Bacteroidota bacterium]|jgi:hypothetical protein